MNSSGQSSSAHQVEVPVERAGQRLDNFLMGHLTGAPRRLVYRLIRTGQVRVNGGRAKPSRRLAPGDRVRIPPLRGPSTEPVRVPGTVVEKLEAAIVFENASLLAVDKPAGMAVHGGSGLAWGIVDAFRQARPQHEIGLVHRLDRDTSGLLLLAKDAASLRHLQAGFRRRETVKRYLALLDGRLPQDRVVVDQPLAKTQRSGERFMQVDARGKAAVTEFIRLEDRGAASFVEAIPVTGRTHQIRAHASFLGMPCAGDERYSLEGRLDYWRAVGLNRLFLHAHALELTGPDGRHLHLSCPLPVPLRAVLDDLPAG